MQRQLYLALALATAGLLGTTSTAVAQKPATPAPAPRPDSGTWRMGLAARLLQQRDTLKLTSEQVKKLEQIQSKYAPKTKADSAAMAARSKRREAGKEAMAVLTTEQRDKFRQSMRQAHANWRAKGDSMHRERHGGRVRAPADSSKTAK
ncbi:MAG TPA: hypothetical protein VF013_11020 [Candidatus Limnocylindria bacterium]